MGGYLALAWPSEDTATGQRVEAVAQRLTRREGWSQADEAEGCRLFVHTAHPLPVRRLSGGWLVGDLFRRADHRPAADLISQPGDVIAQCAAIASAYWGRYAAIWPRKGDLAAFRDPTGAHAVLRWRAGGASLVASEVPAGLGDLAPELALDWHAIARRLASPSTAAGELAVTGLEAATPGVLLPYGPCAGRIVWSPAQFARRETPDLEAAKAAFRAHVDGCVGAYAARGAPILAEVSGGLDSAIVASALVQAPHARVRAWTHFHALDVEGDERGYAQAVAERLGVLLTVIRKPEQTFSATGLAEIPTGLWPSANGLDTQYDKALAKLCADVGAAAILTGQGGDAVFFQPPTPLAAADLWGRGLGLAGWTDAIAAIGRWTRRSAWSVASVALRARFGLAQSPEPAPAAFVSAEARALAGRPRCHPWLKDLRGVAPAKRLQIQGLIYAQGYLGASRRGRVADIIHPLLSQPIVELGLSIPIADLTRGGESRALARAAFRDRLPDVVAERRSKGDVTAYYGRMIARSLEVIRPYLLRGRLAAAGLLAGPVLDAMLREEHLIWRGGYGDLLELIALEAWVRHWRERLVAP